MDYQKGISELTKLRRTGERIKQEQSFHRTNGDDDDTALPQPVPVKLIIRLVDVTIILLALFIDLKINQGFQNLLKLNTYCFFGTFDIIH